MSTPRHKETTKKNVSQLREAAPEGTDKTPVKIRSLSTTVIPRHGVCEYPNY